MTTKRRVRACRTATDCLTVSNVVFRGYTPGARNRDVPNAYEP